MKKQKRVLNIIITLTMLIVLLTPMISFATNETEETTIIFHTKTNTEVYNLGENVKVSVSWESHKGLDTFYDDVQAVEFTLQYDEDKLEFVDATFEEVDENSRDQERVLDEDFYNVETPGTLILSKVSLNNLNISCINLNFKTIAIGEATVQLTDVECVADGNLVSPDIIEFTTNSTKTIKTVAFGDVDLNGILENTDIAMIEQYLEDEIELSAQQLENADVNLDKIVDDIDVVLIRKSLAGSISLPIRYGDVNLDGIVNNRDVTYLMNYLSGIEGYELNEQARTNSDTNVDGIVNKIDYHIIFLYKSGRLSEMPFRTIKNLNIKVKNTKNLNTVFGFNLEKTKVSDLLEYFNIANGYGVYNISDEKLGAEATFGTGTKIKIGGDENSQVQYPDGSVKNWIAEYNVVIYGDTTGDGKINAIDALALIKHLNEAIPFTSEVFVEAGSIVCEEGEEPTAVDALAIIRHANKKQPISQY